MDIQPDFTLYGYEIVQALGHNYGYARSTYLTKNIASQQLVVVKLFRFPKSASQFSAYEKAIAREAQLLTQLQHPAIPCYLSGFDTPEGYCIVQEYKEARSLASYRQFYLNQIYQIAIAVLEVLVYLQSQTPPIIHRDIKPENLLVSDDLKIYLVDFGFARIGKTDIAMSSIAAGTFGFMAPEQLRNNDLSEATDLYGFGMTLLCLLTGKRSTQIDSLIDESNQIKFRHLLTNLNLNPRFVRWLEKMTAPRLKDRYSNAIAALADLRKINISPLPPVPDLTKMAIGSLVFAAIVFVFNIINKEPFITTQPISPSPSPIVTTSVSPPSPPLSPIVPQKTPFPSISKGSTSLRNCTYISVFWKLTEAEEQKSRDSLRNIELTRKCQGCVIRRIPPMARDWQGMDLQNADLRGVNFTDVDLSGANLKGANLEGAFLVNVKLSRANLSETNSKCANFSGAELLNAKLVKANLELANFGGTNMAGADLSKSNLTSAKLYSTNLSGANLNEVDFTDADLMRANLENATMKGVIIQNTRIDVHRY